MKAVEWEKCYGSGACGNQKPQEFRMGMHVSARYAGVDVHLRIVDMKDQQNFEAKILYFEHGVTDDSIDLHEGDQVSIRCDQIFWTFDD